MVSRDDDAASAPILLKLYIAGASARSRRALENLERICGRASCAFEVVDIVEQPAAAEELRILATPVVIRDEPQPARRIVGDLSDEHAVALGLDLPLGGAA